MSALTSGSEVVDTGAWLAMRRKGVGASEAAAALGYSPFESPLQLYLRKTGQIPDPPETDAMRWGKRMEPHVLDDYERETGRRVVRRQLFLVDPARPHVFATLDGLNDRGHAVEVKVIDPTSPAVRRLPEEFSDEIDDHWHIQAQVQLHCAEAEENDFIVQVGFRRPRRFRVVRSESVIARILEGVDAFWDRVERRDPPPPSRGGDAALIPILYPTAFGSVDLPAEARDWADQYELACDAARLAEEQKGEARAHLLALLADHDEGTLADGRRVRRHDRSVEAGTFKRKASRWSEIRILKARG